MPYGTEARIAEIEHRRARLYARALPHVQALAEIEREIEACGDPVPEAVEGMSLMVDELRALMRKPVSDSDAACIEDDMACADGDRRAAMMAK